MSESFSNESDENLIIPETIIEAKKQWENIEKNQNELENLPIERGVGGTIIDRSTFITYFDSKIFLIEESKNINIEIPEILYPTNFCFCITKTIPNHILTCWENIYKITKIQFIETNSIHHRILNSLHFLLTGINTPPLRKGPHWQDVGFQTDDPISDLRSTGMMGLLLPLGLLSNYRNFSKNLINLSRSKEQSFPLMLILIVYTNGSIEALKSNYLMNDTYNENQIWENFLYYFTGTIKTLYDEWIIYSLDFLDGYNIINEIVSKSQLKIKEMIQIGNSLLFQESI